MPTTYVQPNTITVVVTCVFALIYLWVLARRAISGRFDIYHVAMLAVVALLPVGFMVFPKAAHAVSHALGVAFPFVLLFGALFLVMFLYMHRITSELNRSLLHGRRLTQELEDIETR